LLFDRDKKIVSGSFGYPWNRQVGPISYPWIIKRIDFVGALFLVKPTFVTSSPLKLISGVEICDLGGNFKAFVFKF
jgi:hypothetical protein